MIHNILLKTIVVAVLISAGLVVMQMWTMFIEPAFFAKILITLGIFVVVSGFLLVVGIDLGSTKKLKDENYLD